VPRQALGEGTAVGFFKPSNSRCVGTQDRQTFDLISHGLQALTESMVLTADLVDVVAGDLCANEFRDERNQAAMWPAFCASLGQDSAKKLMMVGFYPFFPWLKILWI